MRIQCWYCHKSVSSELPNESFFRAIAVCPECIKNSTEANEHPLEQESDRFWCNTAQKYCKELDNK